VVAVTTAQTFGTALFTLATEKLLAVFLFLFSDFTAFSAKIDEIIFKTTKKKQPFYAKWLIKKLS
tara:strand:+ start:235 stop:429 length:195 start_codon:yes stop_codon:yes gene_type:complete